MSVPKMAKIVNLDFAPLTVRGDNYLQWALDVEISLGAKGLEHCIVPQNKATKKENSKTLMLIRHHIEESLKAQYLTVSDPYELWKELQMRYDHQKTLILPGATYEWIHIRIQDFKSVNEYNSAMFKIVSKLRLCGETVTDKQLLEKTFQTMSSSNMLLQQQYRQKGFKTYSELISCLLLAEQNNELLLKNSELRPPGSKHVPEANHTSNEPNDGAEANHVRYDHKGRGSSYGRGRGRKGHGRGRGQGGNSKGRNTPYDRPTQSNNGQGKGRGNGTSSKPQNPASSPCHRCGMMNHWAKNCRTAKHLVDLYQESLKGKNPEAHMVYKDEEDDFDHDNDDLMEFETSDILSMLNDDPVG
ncbi:uncharacterized protein LOC108808189 [Raphanus sativus]|uniref:Uncharacterized protein LOC108808189 n=1 Tax=Raphanus sativus TaxID=3726 RepID=A0A6J0JM00_RAPSA|nr:uncharacterized protein LOC108808189 [Raphanus sativus]